MCQQRLTLKKVCPGVGRNLRGQDRGWAGGVRRHSSRCECLRQIHHTMVTSGVVKARRTAGFKEFMGGGVGMDGLS